MNERTNSYMHVYLSMLMQSTLGDEGTSLEFRHISSYLLWYCHNCTNEELLHEVILCIGFFSVLNHDNQVNRIHICLPLVLQDDVS